MKSILLLIFVFTSSLYGQDSDASKVLLIDSICSSINNLKPNEYKTYQSSGIIEKKKFVFFYKKIGSFHIDGFYIDDKLLKVVYTQYLSENIDSEVYYFSENKIIRHEQTSLKSKAFNNNEVTSKAYFDKDFLINYKANNFDNFNDLRVLKTANQLKNDFFDLIKF